jgi:hypothetical protein
MRFSSGKRAERGLHATLPMLTTFMDTLLASSLTSYIGYMSKKQGKQLARDFVGLAWGLSYLVLYLMGLIEYFTR